MRSWWLKTEKNKTVLIDGSRKFHSKHIHNFIKYYCPDIPISEAENKHMWPEIIARMYVYTCNKEGKMQYLFSSTFFKGVPRALDYLNGLISTDNIKSHCKILVKKRYDIVTAVFEKATTPSSAAQSSDNIIIRKLRNEIGNLTYKNKELENK